MEHDSSVKEREISQTQKDNSYMFPFVRDRCLEEENYMETESRAEVFRG